MVRTRTRRRAGVVAAAGLMTAGLLAFPALTFADGGGNGHGHGHAHHHGGGRDGHGHGHGQGSDPADDDGDATIDHVVICHVPPGNPDNAHTITVGAPAVAAHTADHGDRSGPCESVTTTTQAPTAFTAASTSTTMPATTIASTTVDRRSSIMVSYTPTGDPRFCSVVIDLTGFGPSQSYDVTLVHGSPTLTNPESPWTFGDVPTDASGTARFVAFTYFQGSPEDASFSASADGVSSDPVDVSC
jgi:hypothetical protein